MKIYYEKNIIDFDAWSGGEDTIQKIMDNDKEKEFESLIEELFPNGIGEMALNDLLRFEQDWIYKTLSIENED